MFKVKNIDVTIYSEFDNLIKLHLFENDGFPLDPLVWELTAYVYRPFDEIENFSLDLEVDSDILTFSKINMTNMNFKDVYKYKIFATKILTPTEKYLIQYGNVFLFDEMRV